MKLKRDELDRVTSNGVGIAILAVVGLLQSKCPMPEMYEICEEQMAELDGLRNELGMETLTPDAFRGPKRLSVKVKQKIAELKAKGKTENKNKIGFQIPGGDNKPGEIEVAAPEEDEIEIDLGFDPSELKMPDSMRRAENDKSKMN